MLEGFKNLRMIIKTNCKGKLVISDKLVNC